MPPLMLSKSKYLNGLRCPRLLWIAVNEPKQIPEPDAATQHTFDQGHLVGELAQRLYPSGIPVPTDNFRANIVLTKELISQRKPMFEAGVLVDKIYSRVDILNPVNADEWDIIEVKSSTSVKEVNLDDVSFQKLCCEDAGLKIRKCFLAFINNQYVKNGEINPEELFTIQDITEDVAAISEGIRGRVAEMLENIGSKRCPETEIGPHCGDPYDCALIPVCWDGMPEHSVFTLYYSGKKSHELYKSGIIEISGIPAGYKLNDKQRIQCKCVVSGQTHIDVNSLKQFLSSLQYPLYFLDFETINPAVPLFNGTRPYQQVPFQFSLHVQMAPGAELQHYSHLADGPQDPRPELLKQLHQVIGNEGSIVVYNQSFEQGVLEDLGEAFPEYQEWSEAAVSRLIDLIVPFRSFQYYHPMQHGSASIKSVLPAITGQGYEGMAIAEGGEASLRYLDITYGEVSEEERQKTREDLLAYCGLDTEAMVRIIRQLEELTGVK